MMNGQVSPGNMMRASGGQMFGGARAGMMDPNLGLAKWFSPELLKQQVANMPPLPMQGQKVLTVDEIERLQQQAVSH